MKKGKELGQAIAQAVELKIDGIRYKSKADIARALGVEPPSLHTWFKTGRVSANKTSVMLAFFCDVTTPSHWGLEDWPAFVHLDTDAYVFVDVAFDVRLPVGTAQEVLRLISENAVEK